MLVTLLSLSTALAGDAAHLHESPILDALGAGQISEHEALWLTYLQHFEPDALPAPYSDAAPGEDGFLCSTGLIQDLKTHWEDFTPEERARITARIAPWKEDLLDPYAPAEGAPPPAANEPCLLYSYNEIRGDHFSVQWDASAATETQANNFLDALEYSWEALFDELGWKLPEGSDRYLITAYINNGGAGAYTTIDYCGGYLIPYIVAGDGSFSGGTWYQDMAGHELNHASQFAYSYAFEFWWWEATATWVEDDIYTTHKAWSDYLWGYAAYPHIAMNAYSQSDYATFYHMYGMAIWGFYLEEYVDPDFVLDSWNYAATRNGTYNLGMDKVFDELGYDLEEAYVGFMAANTVMDYEERNYFPIIDRAATVNALPYDGNEPNKSAPEPYGQNYIAIDPDLASSDAPDLELTFFGEDGADWIAILVGAEDHAVVEIARADLDSTEFSSGNTYEYGQVVLEDFGQYDEVWLVVSPLDGSSKGSEYDYDLAAIDASPAVEDTGGGGGGGGGDEAPGGCGCAAGGGAGAWWALGLALGALRRRRG